jgi:hypothetical protein
MKKVIRTIPEAIRRSLLATTLLAAALAMTATAAHSESGIPWKALSKDEQSVLAKHRKDWSNLSPDKQQKLRKGARKYLQLPPDKRQAVERKHSQYEKMPPEEREKLRKKYSRQKNHD